MTNFKRKGFASFQERQHLALVSDARYARLAGEQKCPICGKKCAGLTTDGYKHPNRLIKGKPTGTKYCKPIKEGEEK